MMCCKWSMAHCIRHCIAWSEKRWIVSKWEKSKVGAVIGLCGAFAAGQLMSGLLFGVSPVDPATFIGGAAGLLLVAAMASAIPGIRAMRIQLVAALVHE